MDESEDDKEIVNKAKKLKQIDDGMNEDEDLD